MRIQALLCTPLVGHRRSTDMQANAISANAYHGRYASTKLDNAVTAVVPAAEARKILSPRRVSQPDVGIAMRYIVSPNQAPERTDVTKNSWINTGAAPTNHDAGHAAKTL